MARLRKAQEDYQLEDEAAGTGQQANSLQALQRESRLLKAGRSALGSGGGGSSDPSVKLDGGGGKGGAAPAGGADGREVCARCMPRRPAASMLPCELLGAPAGNFLACARAGICRPLSHRCKTLWMSLELQAADLHVASARVGS